MAIPKAQSLLSIVIVVVVADFRTIRWPAKSGCGGGREQQKAERRE